MNVEPEVSEGTTENDPPQSPTIKTYQITNQTPYRIGIDSANLDNDTPHPGNSLIIPPFETKQITDNEKQTYNFTGWLTYGLIEIEEEKSAEDQDKGSWWVALGFTVLIILGWLVLGLPLTIITGLFPWEIFMLIAGVLSIGSFILLRFFGMRVAGKQLREGLKRIGIWFQKSPYVLLVLAIGWGLPALTIYFLGGGQALVGQIAKEQAYTNAVLGRLLQFLFLGIATTLPAMLYLLFGRKKLEIVHDTFVKQILVLDPTVQSYKEAIKKYHSLLEEVYGVSNLGTLNQLRGAATPLVISTLLIAMGWTLALEPVGQAGDVIISFFTPNSEPLIFGFLGAYFFTLNMVFRRYVRGDLNPKTYIHVSVRLIATIILVWALSTMIETTGLFVSLTAFIVGIIPETGTTLLQEQFRKMGGGITKAFKSKKSQYKLEEDHPLTSLEGINIYDRARFQEEGINNVENLVYYDLIELIARTRVPIYRLLDLYDQAILYMHLGTDREQIETGIQKLRKYGIRTAMDLLTARKKTPAIVNLLLTEDASEDNAPISSTDLELPEGSLPPRLDVICAIIAEHSWIPNLKYWRKFQARKDKIMGLKYFEALLAQEQLSPNESEEEDKVNND